MSSGFVRGMLSSVKKSIRGLLCLILTFVIFSIIFVPLQKIIFELSPFKLEFSKMIEKYILVGGVVDKLYHFVISIVLMIVLFFILSFTLNLVFKIVFLNLKFDLDIVVTSKVLSVLTGVIRGVILFLFIEMLVLYVGQYFNLQNLQNFVMSSSVGKISYDFLLPHVQSLLLNTV
jgi:hypothetical protein